MENSVKEFLEKLVLFILVLICFSEYMFDYFEVQ
jgi:hypothetical protein